MLVDLMYLLYVCLDHVYVIKNTSDYKQTLASMDFYLIVMHILMPSLFFFKKIP
jgi:hypothetical protein